jgi:hypothetical protein
MIDVRETPDPRGECGRVAVDGRPADEEHPAWCSPAHCFVTDDGVRVHEQAPIRWEAECVATLRFETCLIDPGDDDTTYLQLRMRDLTLRDEFYAILPLDTVRRFRDQLTEHLDGATHPAPPPSSRSDLHGIQRRCSGSLPA